VSHVIITALVCLSVGTCIGALVMGFASHMLQKTTDEALRVEDDLAEPIDLIWMLDAAVRGFEFDPDTPNGRSAAGMASTFEVVVEKLKGCGRAIGG
jgi:hypothetical protein